MTGLFEFSPLIIAGANVLIGVGLLAVIWYGINHMVDANERRAQAGERQEQQSERSHAETMAALKGQRPEPGDANPDSPTEGETCSL